MPTVCSVEEAVAMVRPVDTIGFGLGPANPDTLLTALGTRDDWQDLQVGGALCLNFYEVFTKPGVTYRCGFFGPAERLLQSMGHRVELVPGGFRQMAPILAKFSPRVMVVQAAPPDDDGRVNLSLHLGATRPELLRAGTDPDRLLIVEVNPNLPRTKSLPPEFDNTIPLDVVDVAGGDERRPLRPDRAADRRGRRSDRAPRAVLREERVDPADGHRRHPQHRGHRAGQGPAGRVRRPLRDVHQRPHAAAPGGQGRPTTPRGCSTGSRSRRSPSGRPSSTDGWTATRTSPSFPSRR